MVTAKGRAEGKMVESGGMRYVGAIFYETHSETKLVFLNHLVEVNVYEVDALGYGNGINEIFGF